MKTAELRQLENDALKAELEKSLREHVVLKIKIANGDWAEKKPQLRQLRRHIARVKTLIAERRSNP